MTDHGQRPGADDRKLLGRARAGDERAFGRELLQPESASIGPAYMLTGAGIKAIP